MNILNIAANGKFDVKLIHPSVTSAILDLRKLCLSYYDCIFDTSKSQALNIKDRKRGTTITLYSSGKFWIFGAKNFEAVKASTKKIERLIKKNNYIATLTEYPAIRNITASLDYSDRVKSNLNESVLSKAGFDKYRQPSELQNTFCIKVFETTVKIFPTGLLQIFCAKSFEELNRIEDFVQTLFENSGLI